MFELGISVAGDFNSVVEAIGATENQVKTAAMRALNKTALWLQSKSAKEISSEMQVQLKLIRQKLRIIKASRNSLKAFVVANLYGVKASKLGVMRQTRSGVKVGKHEFSGAFIAKMPKSGHTGAFKRKGAMRLPITEQYVPLEPRASEIIKQNIENEAREVFIKYFKHEVKYVTTNTSR